MNLLRSICCLFAGRCAEEEPKPRKETVRGDLGQTEAELEKAGKASLMVRSDHERRVAASPAIGGWIG
jgi:hypothetical protein